MTVTIRDTRSGNRSCDWSGDLSPTFSEVVYVCLCLFTYVWSLDLFWKLYIVPTLRDLLPLASISTSIPSYQVSLSEVDPVTWGPAYMLSPSLPLGAISGLWGNQLLHNCPLHSDSHWNSDMAGPVYLWVMGSEKGVSHYDHLASKVGNCKACLLHGLPISENYLCLLHDGSLVVW